MCTVSVIHAPAALRLACNRDELLTRPDALPPRVMRFGARLAVLPIDPASDGTWVAVNDAGVAFALLNVNPREPRANRRHATSRGRVIPSVLHCPSAAAAQDALIARDYEPFRLVVIDERALLECVWDGDRLRTTLRVSTGRPAMFTSSGLGDYLVTEPRRQLFESLLDEGALTPARQELFHRHRWEDAPHLSVCMSRADAQTVSYTIVEVARDRATLSYLPGGPTSSIGPSHWCLEQA